MLLITLLDIFFGLLHCVCNTTNVIDNFIGKLILKFIVKLYMLEFAAV